MRKIKKDNISEFYKPVVTTKLDLPEYLSKISAGFPSPADDYVDKKLDLNEYLIQHPSATFFVRVSGDSMINAGIESGDLLVIDRSLEVKNNCIVLAVVNGEFTLKRIKKVKDKIFLVPENSNYKPMEIKEDSGIEIWGVVTTVIKEVY